MGRYKQVKFGHVHADHLDFAGALGAIGELVDRRAGGFVVTPNVDHVCLAETSAPLVDAYRHAALSLADGMPLLWLARLMGHRLPEKISGSDLVMPLMERAAARGWKVALFGGAAGVGEAAAEVLGRRCPGLQVVATLSPPLGFEQRPADDQAAVAALRASGAEVVLVALGCPKQELWMARHAAELAPAVLLGIGATLDFIAGRVRRAPAWMSQCGLEWAFRLAQEPRRMAERYLVRDRAIAAVAYRMLRMPRQDRACPAAPHDS